METVYAGKRLKKPATVTRRGLNINATRDAKFRPYLSNIPQPKYPPETNTDTASAQVTVHFPRETV